MAQKLDRATIGGLYQRYHGRAFTDADVAALGGKIPDMTAEQFTREVIFPSAEYKKAVGTRAAAPYGDVLKQNKAGLSAELKGTDAEYDDLAARIRENAGDAGNSLGNKMSQLGLLRSGATAAGLGNIEREKSSSLSKADIQRSISRSGLKMTSADFESKIKQAIADSTVATTGTDLSEITGQGEYGWQREREQLADKLSGWKSISDIYADPYSLEGFESEQGRKILAEFLESIGYTVMGGA